MVVLGQSSCFWVKVVVVGQSGLDRVEVVVFLQCVYTWANLYSGKSGCILAKWL